ncbi:MAG: complex I subunit 1/NuoH family protein [Candidatus Kariarchaeaceae archaeon]|jgi:NADH-quinone oxidoreductase subunit H
MADSTPGLPFESFANKVADELIDGKFHISHGLLIAIGALVFGAYIMANQIAAPFVERKIMARMQGRRGPVYVGKSGTLQILADTFKLIIKEDLRPAGADRVGFFVSMLVITVTAVLSFAPLPWGTVGLLPGDFSIGILYIFAIFSLFPPAMLIGGWASRSKYSLIGGFRSAGQLIAYEIPMFISILGVIAVAETFSIWGITEYQMEHGWFLFRFWGFGLLAGGIFFLAGYAETERIPFDIPEAESELVMGPRTEFSGWRYALIMFVEYLHLFINSLLFIYLFLGGYDPIPIPLEGIKIGGEVYLEGFLEGFRTNGFVQFAALTVKAYVFVAVAAWMRSALGRLRIDQLLTFGWKILIPLSLACLIAFIAGDPVYAFKEATP